MNHSRVRSCSWAAAALTFGTISCAILSTTSAPKFTIAVRRLASSCGFGCGGGALVVAGAVFNSENFQCRCLFPPRRFSARAE